MSWSTVTLEEVADINPRAPKRDRLADDTLVSFLPMAALSERGTVGNVEDRPASEVRKGYTYFKQGDVLAAKITPCFENKKIGLATIPRQEGFASTEFHVIRPKEAQLDRRYLAYFMRQDWVRYLGEKRMTGSGGQRRVPASYWKELELPLPPLEEQKRIAAILDQADALRRLRQRAIDRLDTLAQSIFFEMFGSGEFEYVPFQMAIADNQIGLVRSSKEFGDGYEFPYVRMDAITDSGEFLESLVKTTDATLEEASRYELLPGDLMFNTRNSRELVGKTAIYRGKRPSLYNNNIMRIRTGEQFREVFLDAYLRSGMGRRELEQRKSGTTSVWAVYWSKLKSLPVPKVDLIEQIKFETLVNEIHSQKAASRQQLSRHDAMFSALQQRAFKGEL